VNWQFVFPEKLPENPTPAERKAIDRAALFTNDQSGYFREQGTRPQTIGYPLADSAAGQALWIYEKFQAWTDNHGNPEDELSVDAMLDDISLYWFTDTAASSARILLGEHPRRHGGPVRRTDRTANGSVGLSARDISARQRPGLRRCGPTCSTGMRSTGAVTSPRSSSQSSSPRSCGRPSGRGEVRSETKGLQRRLRRWWFAGPPAAKASARGWQSGGHNDGSNFASRRAARRYRSGDGGLF